MTKLPRNERSELMKLKSPGFVLLRKESEGGVVDTSCKFHRAWPASNQPALRPMRGSGAVAARVVADDVLYGDCPCAPAAPASTRRAEVVTKINRGFTESSV